jgi:hypothetical protein
MAIDTVRPNGDANSNWTSSTAGNMFDDVNANDGDTSYAFRDDSNITQSFNVPVHSITSTSINKYTVTSETRKITADVSSVQLGIRVNETNYLSANKPQTESYATYTEDWLTNPNSAADWTEADIEGVSANPLNPVIHVRGAQLGAGEGVRCTELFGTVDFEVAAAVTVPDDTLAPTVQLANSGGMIGSVNV